MAEDEEQELAERSRAALWQGDAASRALGMSVDEVGPGRAVASMSVRPDMVNGWGLAHGGLIASLADTAFAFACNSRGVETVTAGFEVTFLEPALEGDLLVATAVERARRGRSGIYDVTVAVAVPAERAGRTVAEFRGRSLSAPA